MIACRSRLSWVAICSACSRASGTAIFAASVGVDARRSATRSRIGLSGSCPIALITGVLAAPTARTKPSSLNGSTGAFKLKVALTPVDKDLIIRDGSALVIGRTAQGMVDSRGRRSFVLDLDAARHLQFDAVAAAHGGDVGAGIAHPDPHRHGAPGVDLGEREQRGKGGRGRAPHVPTLNLRFDVEGSRSATGSA